jgi:oligosaccharide repeat unit polymerase
MIDYAVLNVVGVGGGILLLIHIARVERSFTSAAVIFSLPWIANVVISQVAFEGAIRPQPGTLLILIAAWWTFLFGYLAQTWRGGNAAPRDTTFHRSRAVAVLVVLVALQVAAVVFELIAKGDSLLSAASAEDLAAIRLNREDSAMETPLFFGTFRWSYVIYLPFAMLLRRQKLISSLGFYFTLAVALSSTMLKFTRAPLLQALVVIFVSWNLIYRPSRTKKLTVASLLAALIVVLFLSMQNVLTAADEYAELSFRDSIWAYFGGSAKAYEYLLTGRAGFPEVGYYSLDFVCFPLAKLGVVAQCAQLNRPEVAIPVRTNLYTFLDCFTQDFGTVGAVIGAGVTGLLCGWLSKRVRRQLSVVTTVAVAYATYCCAMAAANNEFIRFSFPMDIVLAGIVGAIVTAPTRSAVEADDERCVTAMTRSES